MAEKPGENSVVLEALHFKEQTARSFLEKELLVFVRL